MRRYLWILAVIVLLAIWFAARKRVWHEHTKHSRPRVEPPSQMLTPDASDSDRGRVYIMPPP